MKTVCPHCRQEHDTLDHIDWQNVTCQKCGNDFTVEKTIPGVPKEKTLARPSTHRVLAIIAILGFLVGLPTGIFGVVALFFSVMVSLKYDKGNFLGAKKASKIAYWCSTIGIFSTVIFFYVSPVMMEYRCSKMWSMSSQSNLKQIGIACIQYSMDYDDYFPVGAGSAGFELLRKNSYLSDYGIYIVRQTISYQNMGCGDQPLNEDITSYAYVGGGLMKNSNDGEKSNMPIAFEKPWLVNRNINVLFMNGRVSSESGKFKNCVEVVEHFKTRAKSNAPAWQHLLANAREIDQGYGK